MKNIKINSLLLIMPVIFLVGCNTPNSAIQTDENNNITIDVDKAVNNVDDFYESVLDKFSNPTK